MKKVIFILAFMLMGSYVNASTVETLILNNSKTEFLTKNTDLKVSVIKIALIEDICTVTVTVTRSDGKKFSATATDHNGDCTAAADAAEMDARSIAAVIE